MEMWRVFCFNSTGAGAQLCCASVLSIYGFQVHGLQIRDHVKPCIDLPAPRIFQTKDAMAKFLFWIAVATVASATTMGQNLKLIPGQSEMLLPRDFGAGICVIGSTCDECFGEGYRICDKIGCFNPDKHQQCCKDAGSC